MARKCFQLGVAWYIKDSSSTKSFSHNTWSPLLRCFKGKTKINKKHDKKNHLSEHLSTHKIRNRKSELHYTVQQAGPPAPPACLATVHPLLQKEIQLCCKEDFLWLDRHLLAKKKCLFVHHPCSIAFFFSPSQFCAIHLTQKISQQFLLQYTRPALRLLIKWSSLAAGMGYLTIFPMQKIETNKYY